MSLLEQLQECKPFCKNFPDPLFVIDKKGNIVDACDIVVELFGVSAKKLSGKNVFKLPYFDKEGVKTLKMLVRNTFARKKVTPPDVRISTKKEGERIVQIITSVVSQNNEMLLFVILRDVTNVRKAEQELANNEVRYRELFDNMRSGVAVYEAISNGKNFVFKDFNKAAQRSDKLKRAEVIGKRVTDVFPNVKKIGFLKVLERVWKNGKAEYFPPTIYEDKRIGRVWWEDYVYKLPSGEVVAAFANVTERMKATEDLRKTSKEVIEERDKIKTIVESIADGVFVIEADGRIILFNEAASRFSGYKPEEAIGKHYEHVLTFVFEKEERSAKNYLRELIESGKPTIAERQLLLVNREQERIPVALSVSSLKGGDGERGSVVVFRDVTKEREIDRMKTEFVSVTSHQLHTPLTGVKWFLELLLRGKAGTIPDNQRKYLEQVYASNERMITLVEDLLSVSRIESGERYVIEKKPTDVVTIIDDVIEGNVDLIEEYRVKVVKDNTLPKQLVLNVDGEKVRQVFYNLISNAVKYSKPRGKVEIGSRLDPDGTTLYVKDYGYGIPKRQQHRIFEKFFRADNVVTKVTFGTGLGTYIMKSIMEAHGGRIWFESEEDVGTTFFITFPRAGGQKKRKRSRRTQRSEKGKT